MPAQTRAGRMGLWPRGRLDQRRVDSGEVSGDQACRGLSRMPGPHGKGHAVALARWACEDGNADYRVVCDVAGIERERALLRASGVALFCTGQDRTRSGGRLSLAQGDERGRGGAVAGPELELRACGIEGSGQWTVHSEQ